jgi:hypothetical protein
LKAPVEQGGFGFQGFVLSDMFALPGDQNIPDPTRAQNVTDEAVLAGLDVERAWQLHYSLQTLARADQSRQAELESAVLLTNGPADAPVLPLIDANNIAVLGIDQSFTLFLATPPKSCPVDPRGAQVCTFHFATDPALGDRGASAVEADPARSIGPFAGIQAAAGGARHVTSGSSAADAADADAIVVVVGYTPADEGEEPSSISSGDRTSLDLPPGHTELVESALDLMKPTVILIESGSIVNLPWLGHPNQNQATIWAGYPGARGALASPASP